jgi:hypothetical protein
MAAPTFSIDTSVGRIPVPSALRRSSWELKGQGITTNGNAAQRQRLDQWWLFSLSLHAASSPLLPANVTRIIGNFPIRGAGRNLQEIEQQPRVRLSLRKAAWSYQRQQTSQEIRGCGAPFDWLRRKSFSLGLFLGGSRRLPPPSHFALLHSKQCQHQRFLASGAVFLGRVIAM